LRGRDDLELKVYTRSGREFTGELMAGKDFSNVIDIMAAYDGWLIIDKFAVHHSEIEYMEMVETMDDFLYRIHEKYSNKPAVEIDAESFGKFLAGLEDEEDKDDDN
jgi:hypothetical protein